MCDLNTVRSLKTMFKTVAPWSMTTNTFPFRYQEAMKKDTLERAREPGFDLKGYLMNAYIHPVFKGDGDDDKFSVADEPEAEQVLVATKRQSRRNTPVPSKYNGSESPSLPEIVNDQRL
jgi:calcium permeable stress-gated cation channel